MTAARQNDYDVIIVGAGSSGCALAARLSEKSTRKLLLLDAGPDYATVAALPVELARANSFAAMMPGHPNNWSFVGNLMPGRAYPMPRGKVVGGSSAINGTYFIRGRPEDFDGWAALGNDEWSYERVLPYFIRSETDLDFGGDFHGAAGPMPVRRARPDQLRPVSMAFVEACLHAGFPENPDKNSPGVDGVGPIPRNCIDGIRMNTALTYLKACRDRSNLTILADCMVLRVLFDGKRATGVEAECHGERRVYRGGEIVLCAGGIKSPQLLMLSGIGSAADLRTHGIAVLHDSPGVGRQVMDHPNVSVLFRVRDDRTRLPPDFMPLQACLNHTAPGSPAGGDLQISCAAAPLSAMLQKPRANTQLFGGLPAYMTRPFATLKALSQLPAKFLFAQALANDCLQLMCSLDMERSTGRIGLASANPAAGPEVQLNYLAHPDDLPRMRVNVRTAVNILATPAFRRLGVKRIAPVDAVLADDAALDAWIAANLATAFHTSCGARMGRESDPAAVVDQRCRVYGVEGLRVVDLSVMPTIVRRGPNATAVMIGERAAAFFE